MLKFLSYCNSCQSIGVPSPPSLFWTLYSSRWPNRVPRNTKLSEIYIIWEIRIGADPEYKLNSYRSRLSTQSAHLSLPVDTLRTPDASWEAFPSLYCTSIKKRTWQNYFYNENCYYAVVFDFRMRIKIMFDLKLFLFAR